MRKLAESARAAFGRLSKASWWRPVVAAFVVIVYAYAVWWYLFSSGLLAPAGFVYAQY